MAKAFRAILTLVAVNALMGGVGKTGAVSYLWDDTEQNRILESARDFAKAAGVAVAKPIGLKSRDAARVITIFAEECVPTTSA